ncbi:MAG: hypothetical protein AAB914_02380 [Patescibacteria group bacterium]
MLAKLRLALDDKGPFPQLVDPRILDEGDVFRIVDGFEKFTIAEYAVRQDARYRDDPDVLMSYGMKLPFTGIIAAKIPVENKWKIEPPTTYEVTIARLDSNETKEKLETYYGFPAVGSLPDEYVATKAMYLIGATGLSK